MAFEYLAQYTTFESIADMDTAVENHMTAHYYDLTESERAIVFKLASHALEYPGACHLKVATIAAKIGDKHKDSLSGYFKTGISRNH